MIAIGGIELIRLLQLASPALPVGAFSYSGGLEGAIEAGLVTDAASAERVLRLLEQLGFDLFASELLHTDSDGNLMVLTGLIEFREHLGGDLLPRPRINQAEQINESILGIAHLRLVEHGFQPVDSLDDQVKAIDSQIDVLSKAFQGLTTSCARCTRVARHWSWHTSTTGCAAPSPTATSGSCATCASA